MTTTSSNFHCFFLHNNVHKMIVSSLHRRIQRVLLRCEPCLLFVTRAGGGGACVLLWPEVTGVMMERCEWEALAGGLEVSFLLLNRVEGLQ